MRIASVIFLSLFFAGTAFSQECVVLLHGLARTSNSMEKLETRLVKEGYAVINIDYPSRKYSIQTLSLLTVAKGINECEDNDFQPINFVTHSLGGILVRFYLSEHQKSNIGRVVMLGPPNQGSQVIDILRNIPGFKIFNGPAAMQLGTDPYSVPQSLGPVNFELGVIAGTQSINLLLSTLLPNPDDGKVSLESTRVEGMRDFIALPTTHPFMMKNKEVIEETVHFLQYGKFRDQNL